LHKLARVFKHLERLLQVDDVNAVAFPKDVFLHFGVPALGLVAKVDTRLKQLLHGDVSQNTSLLNCILRGPSCPLGIDSLLRSRRCGREDFGPGDQPLNSALGTPGRMSKAKLISTKTTGRPMPSCSKNLALGELEPLARSLLSILLALFAACIAGKKTFRFQF